MELLQLYEEVSQAAELAAGSESRADAGAIGRLCDAWAAASVEQRKALPTLDGWPRVALLAYAWHAAEDAVTRSDPKLIDRGLIALRIVGEEDWARLAVLWNSAQRLGLDAASLFRGFEPFLATSDKSLEAYSIRADENDGALHYRYEPGPTKGGWWQRWFGLGT